MTPLQFDKIIIIFIKIFAGVPLCDAVQRKTQRDKRDLVVDTR